MNFSAVCYGHHLLPCSSLSSWLLLLGLLFELKLLNLDQNEIELFTLIPQWQDKFATYEGSLHDDKIASQYCWEMRKC